MSGNDNDNEIITPEMITNESLRLLHDKLPFVSRINRRYSDEFKQGGARRSDEVMVRFPNRYVVREGATLKAQSTQESVAYLKLSEQKGVDLEVTSKDLTLHIDDFSRRYLEPAMSTLASTIEEDVLRSVLTDVVHVIQPKTVTPMPDWYDGMSLLGAWFDVNLIPSDQRRLVMNSYDQAEMVDSLKDYAQRDRSVSRQYETGRMRRFQGFDIGMSLSMPMRESRGRVEMGDDYGITPLELGQIGDSFDTVNATPPTGEETMKPLPKPGDWITFEGVYPVHPETKDPMRLFGLKPFKVESVVDDKVTFTPRLVWAGPKQNAAGVSGELFNAVLNKGTDGQNYYRWNVAFDPEAIAFVTADLALPKDVDFAHRSNHDGIGMRVVRKYDINQDRFPCRIDVLYGRLLLRPDSVCLLVGNSDA
ncbi:MAG: P22 phage major capsid protein family protein [Candidatus Thiodiazotropha endolucinida]